MTLKELRYILAVKECETISKAAKKLYISQPALSQYIKNLEASLNIKLFKNEDNKLTMTDAGLRYAEVAGTMLEVYDKMMVDIQTSDYTLHGTLRVGITTFRGASLFPRILPKFKNMYPNVDIIIYEERAEQLELALSAGTVDLLVIKDPSPAYKDKFEYMKLWTEELFLSLPAGHHLSDKGERLPELKQPWFDLKLLNGDECFILFKAGHRTRMMSNELLESVGIVPERYIETANAETALRLSAAGLGPCFIPGFFANDPLVYGDTPPLLFSLGPRENPGIKSNFYIVYRKNAYLTKYILDFISLIIDYCNSL